MYHNAQGVAKNPGVLAVLPPVGVIVNPKAATGNSHEAGAHKRGIGPRQQAST